MRSIRRDLPYPRQSVLYTLDSEDDLADRVEQLLENELKISALIKERGGNAT